MSGPESVAYELRADSKENFAGGSVVVGGEGKTLDLAAALAEGNGTIVVDAASPEEHALDAVPVLKRVGVPDEVVEPAPLQAEGEQPPAPTPATDAAIKLANELGINLAEVDGTGVDGRVTMEDVEEFAEDASGSED